MELPDYNYCTLKNVSNKVLLLHTDKFEQQNMLFYFDKIPAVNQYKCYY